MYDLVFFLTIRPPPRSTPTDPLFPDTTLFRSERWAVKRRDFRSSLIVALELLVALNGISEDDLRSSPWLAHQHPCILERSAEHTSVLQSLMRISYAVFCLKKKTER